MRRFAIALGCVLVGSLALLSAQSPEKGPPKKLSPEEMRKAVSDLLQKLDRNQDGALSADELPGQLSKLMEKLDRNSDGKLDRQELVFLAAITRGGLMPAGGMNADFLLKQFDTNRDGKIARSEAKARLAESFDMLDANKDGFLDRKELAVIVQRMADQKKGFFPRKDQGPAGPDFDALDKDADGRLTASELKGTSWATRFTEIDADRSGQIDRREFGAYLRRQEKK